MTDEELKEIRSLRETLQEFLRLYKLVNTKPIKEAKSKILASSETRKKIYELCDGSKGVSEIARELNIKQPTATHHLSELADAGLIASEVRGGKKYFIKIIKD